MKYILDAAAGWCIVSLAVVVIYDFMRLFNKHSPRAAWPFQMTALGCTLAGLLYIIRVAFNIDQLRTAALALALAVGTVVLLGVVIGKCWGKR